MATGVVSWSKTAATNATADSAGPFPEGMAPSAVNDGVRGLMASVAKYRDDTAGTLTTGGTSTAYTVSTNQGFATLAAMDGAELTIKFNAANGAAPTLAVDSLAAKPINVSVATAVGTGVIAANSIWSVTYDNSDGVFLLRGVPGTLPQTTGTDLTLSGILTLSSTDHMTLPKGSAAQRPGSPAEGHFRHNSDVHVPEYYDGTSWNALTPALPVPQGYLTLTSGTPILAADAVSQTVVYYTPFTGTWAVVHNGTSLVPYNFTSQMSLTLTSSQAASGIYDIFLAYNSGTPVIGTGPSWSAGTSGSVTAGSCARGTGAGGAALSRLSGFYVNTASMSLIWNTGSGNTTITVGASQGIYLGSILIDGSAGQVTCHRSYGQSRKWGVWNAFNRAPMVLQVGDSTSSWTYGSATVRQSNAAAGNSCVIFTGLPEEICNADFIQNISTNTNGSQSKIGIGFNTTTAASGTSGLMYMPSGATSGLQTAFSRYVAAPALGINVLNCVEAFPTASGLGNFNGTVANMLMTASYRA